MLKKINHIGIAVRSLKEAIPYYAGSLHLTFHGVEEVAGYKVRVAFFQIGESKIELLEPMGEGGFLSEFLSDHGPGIHHLAYDVEDLESVIQRLETEGTRMLDRTPRQGAHGAKVAFLHPESSQGILTELCQVADRALPKESIPRRGLR